MCGRESSWDDTGAALRERLDVSLAIYKVGAAGLSAGGGVPQRRPTGPLVS
jgi:hypothetical protein